MKVEKIEPIDKSKPKNVVEHFYNYKGVPMVRIKGNFYGNGFNLSKNKLLAILANKEALADFAAGRLDEQILNLNEDEVLKP